MRLLSSSSAPLLSLFVGLALSATPTEAANFFVRQSGSDSNTGTSASQAFRTVGKAIEASTGSDVIFIGAGTYTESIKKTNSSSSGSLRIIGDTTGRYTGDRGSVICRPTAGRWFLQISGLNALQISDVDFEDPGYRTGYAITASRVTRYAYLIDCSFRDLKQGLRITDSALAYVANCDFNDDEYGVYTSKVENNYVNLCGFVDCRYGVTTLNSGRSYFYNSSSESQAAAKTGARAFYAQSSESLYASGLTSQDDSVCLQGNQVQAASVSNCKIERPKSRGVKLVGANLVCQSVAVDGNGSQRGYGIELNDTEGGSFNLQDCRLEGLYGGLLMNTPGTFKQVSFVGNRIAIRVNGLSEGMSIDGSQGLTLQDNTYGVFGTLPTGQQGSLRLRNLGIRGGSFGIYTSNISISASGQSISGANNAIRAYGCDSFVMSDSKIDSANVDNANIGVLAYAQKTSIDGVAVNGFSGGINIQNQSDTSPKLTNCTLTNCRSYGLYLRGGKAFIDASSNLRIADCRIGIYPYDCDLVVDRLPAQERCDYPLYCILGSLRATNLELRGHQTGVHVDRQMFTSIENCTIKECKGWGIDARRTEDLRIKNVNSSDNGTGGMQVYLPAKLVSVEKFVAKDNQTYGLYCNTRTTLDLRINDMSCSGCRYGFRSIGVPINNSVVSELELVDNDHGLRVEGAKLELDQKSQVKLTGNNYAVMSYNSSMHLDGVKIHDNTSAVYCWNSALTMSNCDISADTYGVLSYRGGAKISDCSFSKARYGIYFSPRNTGDRKMQIADCEFNDISYIGFYSYGYQGDAFVEASGLKVDAKTYGVYTIATDLSLKKSLLNSGTHTLYFRNGRGTVSQCEIIAKNGWGVLDYGRELRLDNSQVRSRHGVYLRCNYAKLKNNVIQGSTYGVYGNLASGKFEILQSTIGNVTHYGVYRVAGDMIVRNTIVDANIYAMYNSRNPGAFEHDHNLVHANRANFVGAEPGLAELEKDPIFLDPAKGDLHLAAGSPAINSGVDLTSELTADIEGNARPSFKQFEIGAYEFTENEGSIRVLEWDEKAK